MLLAFYPRFAEDSDELDLKRESCVNEEAHTINFKCKGWFRWLHQVLKEQAPQYALYRVSYFSCYGLVMSAGIILGIAWILCGGLAIGLSQVQSKGLGLLVRPLRAGSTAS